MQEDRGSDERTLVKLQAICEELGQPHHDELPLASPGELCCVYGCALNGAVKSLHVTFGSYGDEYAHVSFSATSHEAADVLERHLGGIRRGLDVYVRGNSPEMRWMYDFDHGLKPHLTIRHPGFEDYDPGDTEQYVFVSSAERHWHTPAELLQALEERYKRDVDEFTVAGVPLREVVEQDVVA
jgi:hypothetical protein